jgi:hypothetical protein
MQLHLDLLALLRLPMGCQKKAHWQSDTPIFATSSIASTSHYQQHRKKRC